MHLEGLCFNPAHLPCRLVPLPVGRSSGDLLFEVLHWEQGGSQTAQEKARASRTANYVSEHWNSLSWVRNISNMVFFLSLTNARDLSAYLAAAFECIIFNMVCVVVSVCGSVHWAQVSTEAGGISSPGAGVMDGDMVLRIDLQISARARWTLFCWAVCLALR